MKWIFLVLMLAAIPLLSDWLRRRPREMPKAAFALGFLPITLGSWHLYIAPISWAMWPGYVKGVEVSVLDSLAVAIFLASRKRVGSVPLKWPWLVYAATIALSVAMAGVGMAASMYVWQVLRMLLVYTAVVRMCAYPKAPEALLAGFICGLGMEAAYSVVEYAQGITQAAGTLGSQNLVGLISHFAVFPAFAMLLAGRRGMLPLVGTLSGVAVEVLTASRATVGFAAVGFTLLLVLSLCKRFTPRKGAILGIAIAVGLAITPFAMKTIGKRAGSNDVDSSDSERAAFNRAAWLVIHDYPWGTGANQYVVVANTGGYSERAGVHWNANSRGTNVHDSYLLVLAETGPAGLAAALMLLLIPIWIAFTAAFRFRNDRRSDVLLGVGVALTIVALHFLYEWLFVVFLIQYMLAMSMGLVVGIALQLGYWRPKAGRRKRPVSAPAAPMQPVPAE